MRDLTRETIRPSRDGQKISATVDEVLGHAEPEEPEPAPPVEVPPTPASRVRAVEHVKARRDWMIARIAVVLVDAAKILDPITRIVVARFLAVASLVAATGVTLYTIRLTEGWERVAVAGIFTWLAALLIRKGQG